MSGMEPYSVQDTLLERNRLRSAAKRGDKRAELTLEVLDQAAHEARWAATEHLRAKAAADRADREKHRPRSVSAVMQERRREREAAERKRAEDAEHIEAQRVAGMDERQRERYEKEKRGEILKVNGSW
ncbi:translation initiation factor 2B subunit (eIF-2B alpha/beta/delta family) [Friedmanniella endophytica]|uniref:Translation initiation factor 2B subunit (eIF-2B alpha/beta/delta family) n=1 Tax=Microlunatus kandeliicorticis TaxID=1759536 RepID=A0A7W3P6H7_9ACTN|nr:hypothetical protein [Microlunatus kandeliicorticis]MBA8794925.1 translation initiation factor 2B subunit (eIF-2B alpha/beta/delta family) [Microlunatus kandeliicorticis]